MSMWFHSYKQDGGIGSVVIIPLSETLRDLL